MNRNQSFYEPCGAPEKNAISRSRGLAVIQVYSLLREWRSTSLRLSEKLSQAYSYP
jgi:hypothetical protein